MSVLKWNVRDVAPKNPWEDKYQSEWRAEFRGYALIVLRNRGAFEYSIEKDGSRLAHVQGIRTLIDAQERAIERAGHLLNGRALSDAEYNAINLPILVDLAEVYETAARRAADAGLYGEELNLRVHAERYRREAEGLRRSVAQQLATKEGPQG